MFQRKTRKDDAESITGKIVDTDGVAHLSEVVFEQIIKRSPIWAAEIPTKRRAVSSERPGRNGRGSGVSDRRALCRHTNHRSYRLFIEVEDKTGQVLLFVCGLA